MQKKRQGLFWALGLILGLWGFVPNPVRADDSLFTPKDQRFPILTQQEFLGLDSERQREYLLILRDFVVDVSRLNPNGFPAQAHHRNELLLQLLASASMERVSANTQAECQLAVIQQAGLRQVRLLCPGRRGVSDSVQVSTGGVYDDPQEVADRLLSQLNSPQYQGAKLNMTSTELARQVQRFQEEDNGSLRFQASVRPLVNKDVRLVSTPARTEPVVVISERGSEPLQTPSLAGPVETTYRTNQEGAVTETVSNTEQNLDQIGAARTTEPQVTDISSTRRAPSARAAEEASMQKLRGMEEEHKNSLRCIYAGFPVRRTKDSDSCRPVGSFLSEKSKQVFACRDEDVSSEHRAISAEIVLPAKAPNEKVVLCHPLVFGLDKDGRPFCVPRNASATESCRFVSSRSSQKEASLESAIRLARENPMSLSEMRWTFEKLCQGNEADLRSVLQPKSEEAFQKSKGDLGKTCLAYEQKLAVFPGGARLPANRATGTR